MNNFILFYLDNSFINSDALSDMALVSSICGLECALVCGLNLLYLTFFPFPNLFLIFLLTNN